jgi:hypothetical protein
MSTRVRNDIPECGVNNFNDREWKDQFRPHQLGNLHGTNPPQPLLEVRRAPSSISLYEATFTNKLSM